jgi:hypothetical protein
LYEPLGHGLDDEHLQVSVIEELERKTKLIYVKFEEARAVPCPAKEFLASQEDSRVKYVKRYLSW